MWDHAVFGTELKPAVKNLSQANEAKMKKKDGFFMNKKPGDGTENELLDETNRPTQKVWFNVVNFSVVVLALFYNFDFSSLYLAS